MSSSDGSPISFRRVPPGVRPRAIERMARDARAHTIAGGATEVMLEEVAKRWSPA